VRWTEPYRPTQRRRDSRHIATDPTAATSATLSNAYDVPSRNRSKNTASEDPTSDSLGTMHRYTANSANHLPVLPAQDFSKYNLLHSQRHRVHDLSPVKRHRKVGAAESEVSKYDSTRDATIALQLVDPTHNPTPKTKSAHDRASNNTQGNTSSLGRVHERECPLLQNGETHPTSPSLFEIYSSSSGHN